MFTTKCPHSFLTDWNNRDNFLPQKITSKVYCNGFSWSSSSLARQPVQRKRVSFLQLGSSLQEGRKKQKGNLCKTWQIIYWGCEQVANSGEFTLDMIGELLTHKDTKMTRRYAQFLPDTKRKASDLAATLLQSDDSIVVDIHSTGRG